jgi:hypothetical protein
MIMTPFTKATGTPLTISQFLSAIERTGQLKNKCFSDSMLPHPPTQKIDDFVSFVYANRGMNVQLHHNSPKILQLRFRSPTTLHHYAVTSTKYFEVS